MARKRSPNYPAVSLPQALDMVRRVYDADHLNKMHRETVAKHLGYGGLNGASITLISALTKYGLLEGRGGEIRVSRDALPALVDPPGSPERAEAIRRAALSPELFAELHRQFGERLPSEENLKAHLQKQLFTPIAAAVAADAYRETMELVSREAVGYEESMPVQGRQESPAQTSPPATQVLQRGQEALGHGRSALQPMEQELARFPLPGGRSVRLLFTGPAPTQKEVEKLIALLELSKDTFDEGGE